MEKTKSPKFVEGKYYYIEWVDHATAYTSWTDKDKMKLEEDLYCETVGICVKETESSIYLALSKYKSEENYCCLMQIIKSCIVAVRQIK